MSNNNSRNTNRATVSGVSLMAAAVGVVVGMAAVEHAHAQEQNRESVVEGIGRWIREHVFEGGTHARAGPSAGARPLSPAEIDALPVRRLEERDVALQQGDSGDEHRHPDDEKAFCVVCRESYGHGDTLMRLPCFHEFHSECIRDYLESTDTPLCPICRYPVSIQ